MQMKNSRTATEKGSTSMCMCTLHSAPVQYSCNLAVLRNYMYMVFKKQANDKTNLIKTIQCNFYIPNYLTLIHI